MFKYWYTLQPHPTKDGLVAIQPTRGTYAKALLPGLVLFGVSLTVGAILSAKEQRELDQMYKETSDEE